MSIVLSEDMLIDLSSLRLIGIHGLAGVGKDTAAEYLNEKYDRVYADSFADPLKRACSEAFGVDLEDFRKREKKEAVHPYWGVSPRKMAQFVGTELFRHHAHTLLASGYDSFWIARLEGRLTNALPPPEGCGIYEAGDTVCVTDVRFQNEYDWIIRNGGRVLHITRDQRLGQVGILGHASEAGVQFTAPERTWLINNSHSMEAFHAQLDRFAEHIGLDKKYDPFPL